METSVSLYRHHRFPA